MRIRSLFLGGACATSLLCALPAQALNILVTNDDGYAHPNLRALVRALRADGHTVKVSAPWADQSGIAGAVFFLRETQVGRDPDPAYPDVHYLKTTQTGVCAAAACRGQTIDIEVTATPVMAVGASFSALEVVPLILLGKEAYEHWSYQNAAPWARRLRWPLMCFVAVAFWNMVGAGVFGFLINPPISLFYLQGLNTTAVHAHAALARQPFELVVQKVARRGAACKAVPRGGGLRQLACRVLRHLGWLVVAAVQKVAGFFQETTDLAVPPDPERRRILLRTMSLGVLAATAALVHVAPT